MNGSKCTESRFNCFTPGSSVFKTSLTEKQMKASVVSTSASTLFIFKRQISCLAPLSGTCTFNILEISETGQMSTRLFVKLVQYKAMQRHKHGIKTLVN